MKQATKKKGKDLCLDHFDLFYKKNFEKIWPSLRLALLSRPKFCALLNNYGDPETSINRLKHMGCYSIKKQYNDAFEQIQETVSDNQLKINGLEREEATLRSTAFVRRFLLVTSRLVGQTDEWS